MFCSTGQIHKALMKMEKQGLIEVVRNPSHTETGRESSFWEEDGKHHVTLRRKAR